MSSAFGELRTLPASSTAKTAMNQLVAKGIFNEMRDVWTLGASLGIRFGEVHERGKRGTFQNVNSLDPEGIFAAIMSGLYPDLSPKERAKKLIDHAEWGIREISRREKNGTLDFAKLVEYAFSAKPKSGLGQASGKSETLQTNTHIQSDAVFGLLGDCNNICSSKEKEGVFKLTNKVLKRIADVGTPIKGKDDFGNFIDALYEIIYEGSGRLKRVPESFKRADFIGFVINFIRIDLRHDIEHGDANEIRRKKRRNAQIYQKYTSKTSLSSLEESDYQKLQFGILKDLKMFLANLKEYCIESENNSSP